MAQEMNAKLEQIMKDTTDEEKITLLYEIGTYFLGDADYDALDDNEIEFVEELANLVNAIDNIS